MKKSISIAELKQLYSSNQNILLIDVRSREEFLEKHIPFAIHVPIGSIESGTFVPEPGKILITTCGKGGGRSEKAAECLKKIFAGEVYILEGGTLAWYA